MRTAQTIVMNPAMILTALLIVFSILGIVALIRLIAAVVSERASLREKQQNRVKWGGGLRYKLALAIISLALIVTVLVPVLLHYIMSNAGLFAGLGQSEKTALLCAVLFTAGVALIAGIIGACVISWITMRPLRGLLRHVKMICDTENKKNLAGMEIHIAGRDEFSLLGEAINEMTRRLAKAATAASDLLIGKEIQKRLLSLEIGEDGNKLSSGYLDTENAAFFGYYEEASQISGDYFDYSDLGGKYYAVIKCDVAGKGIPAALIMIQVATMFLNYFKKWSPSVEGMHIEELVYQINGFIETLGLTGRFAAFTLCLFDSHSGDLHFCNAGDNIIHIFDSSEKRIKNITLPETPAAGILSNDMVESKGGYKVQTITLDHGDILLMYTDGIEESKRMFRDNQGGATVCSAGIDGSPHGNHTAGQTSEEMGRERIHKIVNAVMNREIYTLRKLHYPGGEQKLQFDYSGCSGNIDEVIMAIIACEKMFRCYRHHGVTKDDRVLIDKKTDDFLKAHLIRYNDFCANTIERHGNDLYYTCLKEEALYDDITILGIKRK